MAYISLTYATYLACCADCLDRAKLFLHDFGYLHHMPA